MRLVPTAAVLVVTLALTGCVALPDTAPKGPVASAIPAHASVIAAPFATQDPSVAPALRSVSYARGGAAPVQGTWAYVDGAPGFDHAVDDAILTVLDAAGPAPFAPSLGAGAVRAVTHLGPKAGTRTIGVAVVDAAGTMVGTRLSVTDPSGTTRPVTTLYTDVVTDQVLDGSGLAADPTAVMDVVRRTEGAGTSIAGAAATPPAADAVDDRARLRDASIGPAGQLVVPDPTDGRPDDSVVLPADMARPLLSGFGLALQRAIAQGVAPVAGPTVGAGLVHVPCAIVACVALTYDDGPDPATTPQVVEALRAAGAHGTFFEEGRNVAQSPATTRAVEAAGDVVGDHTWDHPDLTTLTTDQVGGEVERTDDAFEAAGLPPAMLFRAPYGQTNDAVRAAIGKPLVHWSVDSFDWKSRDAKKFVPLVLRKIRPGGIVLMHDVYKSTVDGQRTLIAGLQKDGYALVTVPQLFAGIPLRDGVLYACRGAYTPDTGVPCAGR